MRARTIAVAAAVLSIAAALGPPSASAAPLRPDDPVVLTGADLPALLGSNPRRILAFAWRSGHWAQVPVQVDERAEIDLGPVWQHAPAGWRILTYTDPGTLAGPDPDPALDANDEVAAMARDAGAAAVGAGHPGGTFAGGASTVRVADPLKPSSPPAYLYLFRGDGSRDPSAGRRYVDYRFGLLSGAYPASYHFAAGPNPEDSAVTTAAYSRHFSDRWVDDGLTFAAGSPDILDRHKNLFAPGNCARSEDTFSAGEGGFVINKSGPVRAIRSYIGANSGPYTQRTHLFYANREDIDTFLRVHAIGGIMDFFDYSPAAAGMTYRNSLNPAGVTIDGIPDSPVSGMPGWEQVSGSQGALTMVHDFTTDVSLSYGSYYLDDSSPGGGAETQCTGDAASYGASGPTVTSTIPNTDPTNGPASHLTDSRHIYYDPPGAGESDALDRAQQIANPLSHSERLRVAVSLGIRSGALSGRVCPAPAAHTAALRRRTRRGAFATVRRLRLRGRGACRSFLASHLDRPGAYRVTVRGDAAHAPATSLVAHVRGT